MCPRRTLPLDACAKHNDCQVKRCVVCRELRKRYAMNHGQAIALGGTGDLGNLTLLSPFPHTHRLHTHTPPPPQRHTSETEKPEPAGNRSCILLESRLPPVSARPSWRRRRPGGSCWATTSTRRWCQWAMSVARVSWVSSQRRHGAIAPDPIGCLVDELGFVGNRLLAGGSTSPNTTMAVGRAKPSCAGSMADRACTHWGRALV